MLADFKDPEKFREYVSVTDDPDDRLSLSLLRLLARSKLRSSTEKVKKLHRLGRYQRHAAAQLSKAIRNN